MSALLKRFRVNRLYGYKDIQIDFSDKARILIAGNGSGKTTILNALHAFLTCRFYRLQSLDFESIECDFEDLLPPIRLERSQIGAAHPASDERLSEVASVAGIDEGELQDFLHNEYKIGGIHEQRHLEIVRSIYSNSPGDYGVVGTMLDSLASAVRSKLSPQLAEVAANIKSAMGALEVLYLPTYRRIELPLLRPARRPRALAGREPAANDAPPGMRHINFGLADVEKRLKELSESVERISNFEYRRISATILDEALANQIGSSAPTSGMPDIESLQRFLARVARDMRGDFYWELQRGEPIGSLQSKKRIAAISELYKSGEIFQESQNFLRYFLSRLGSVIEKTKETEEMLQRFVDACNTYLSDSSDEKKFTYDIEGMRVAVINTWSGCDIPLGNLSSGEKQIVSILAKLYLYDHQKFVLIDEPELSLSIDWQRRILVDMLASGSVSQLLAITHSPFIFENELDPFAGPLHITRHKMAREV